MAYDFYDNYTKIPPELMKKGADPEAVRSALVGMISRDVPSWGRWEYLVQEHSDDPDDHRALRDHLHEMTEKGVVRLAFGHVHDEGATYYCSVDNTGTFRDLLRASPCHGKSGVRRRIEPLSPPLVGLNILMQSTQQFMEQVKNKEVDDPFGIYDANLGAMKIPNDINFGTRPHEIDTSNALYLINEKLPSFGVRVDPLADLAMHALSLNSVQHLLNMYDSHGCIIIHKPPIDIGNIRVINPASMSEFESNVKSHPWFGTIGPTDRIVTALTPLEM